jgi:hypothetical protein
MDQLPTTLTHLYMNPEGPFRSISELPTAEAYRVMDQMTGANTWHPMRFSLEKRDWYFAARRRSEERLHAAIVQKGGRPKRRQPYYLFLDPGLAQNFYPGVKRVHVPLHAIPTGVLSFTYLDSMVCDALLGEPERVPPNCRGFARLSCISEVYRLEELPKLIEEFGYPQGTYLEAQVWDDAPLEPYRRPSSSRDGEPRR